MNEKYDLNELGREALRIKQSFFKINWSQNKSFDQSMKDKFVDISYKIDMMIPSIIAPVYHYNNYIDFVLKDKLEMKSLYKTCYQIESQSTFIALKIGLDRMVQIFNFYYKGISSHTTFGRYKESGKPRGFMAVVENGKENDPLLEYIFKQYHKWIQIAVAPRDVITHYKDLGLVYVMEVDTENPIDSDFNFRPVHITKEISNGINDQTEISDIGVTHIELKELVDNWYSFYNNIMGELLKRSTN